MKPLLSEELLQALTSKANHIQKKRINFNLHTSYLDPVQRLCNAIEPDTYIKPHKHAGDDRWEFFVILKGSCDILMFSDDGLLIDRVRINKEGPCYGIEIPTNTYHTLFSNQPGTVVFEIKPGPFVENHDKVFANWAPNEGHPEVRNILNWFKHVKVGEGYLNSSADSSIIF